jgi:hypothetical protein
MEPEGSLPCSQEPYPEPDQSSPYHTALGRDVHKYSYILFSYL